MTHATGWTKQSSKEAHSKILSYDHKQPNTLLQVHIKSST